MKEESMHKKIFLLGAIVVSLVLVTGIVHVHKVFAEATEPMMISAAAASAE